MSSSFDEHFAAMPLVAILRGIAPAEVEDVARVLLDEGIRLIEIPLNTPHALESIALLSAFAGCEATVGAGTVMASEEVEAVSRAGGTLIVSPHCDPSIIQACLQRDMVPVPGFRTATEAFRAVRAGARILKFFPATIEIAPEIGALNAVLARGTRILAVGGVNAKTAGLYRRCGAAGVGVGAAIFAPRKMLCAVRRDTRAVIESWAGVDEIS